LDIFAVADRLRVRGWYVDRQGPPASIHCTVHAGHESTIANFIDELRASVQDVLSTGGTGESGSYATIE
jgi:hypothetical protein